MKQRLAPDELTYDRIRNFVEEAARQNLTSRLYLFWRAAACVNLAYVMERITEAEASELRARIAVLAARNTP